MCATYGRYTAIVRLDTVKIAYDLRKMAYDLTRDIVPDTVTDIVRERTSRARYRKISYIRENIAVLVGARDALINPESYTLQHATHALSSVTVRRRDLCVME